MSLKEKIISVIEHNRTKYQDGKYTLFDAIDSCYDDINNISDGKAIILAEEDDSIPNLFKDDIIHRFGEDFKGKTITFKDFFYEDIGGITLFIVIAKEKIL